MNNKTRSMLKALAVIVVLVAVLLETGILNLPSLLRYSFWMVVVSFGVLLISSR